MTSIDLDESARAVWEAHYAPRPDSIAAKLALGHQAYERAVADAAGTMALQRFDGIAEGQRRIETAFREGLAEARRESGGHAGGVVASVDLLLRSATERILTQVETRRKVEAVENKLTAKGGAFEASVALGLRSHPGVSSVGHLRERDERNAQGGDIVVTDLAGNTCVVECKDKTNITAEDLAKFERDADAWTGAPALFAFLVRGGIGSCRKLQQKPLLETTPAGATLLWFRGDEDDFVRQLPFVIGLFGQKKGGGAAADGATRALLDRASGAISFELKALRSDISAEESARATGLKRIAALRKREAALMEIVDAASAAALDDAPDAKRVRTHP